jgi:hypothetical protein
MILYHFTGPTALKQMGSFNEADVFVLREGLRRGAASMREWEGQIEPLPPNAVWFTSDPSADLFKSPAKLRITAAIPSTDRRLVRWLTYLRRHCTASPENWSVLHDSPAAKRFYLYFGDVPLSRIRSVEEARIITDTQLREKLAA